MNAPAHRPESIQWLVAAALGWMFVSILPGLFVIFGYGAMLVDQHQAADFKIGPLEVALGTAGLDFVFILASVIRARRVGGGDIRLGLGDRPRDTLLPGGSRSSVATRVDPRGDRVHLQHPRANDATGAVTSCPTVAAWALAHALHPPSRPRRNLQNAPIIFTSQGATRKTPLYKICAIIGRRRPPPISRAMP
jgi:hypothetical protein